MHVHVHCVAYLLVRLLPSELLVDPKLTAIKKPVDLILEEYERELSAESSDQ